MGEIKSTWELVMQRAEAIGRASREEIAREEAKRQGMRHAAEYLDGRLDDLAGALRQADEQAGPGVRLGMIEGLLRNVFLGKDEVQLGRIRKALEGLAILGGSRQGQVLAACRDLDTVVSQYARHREQLKRQLEDQVSLQLEQLMRQQGDLQGRDVRLDPTMQPRFQEEWARVETELAQQYGQALDQHKQMLTRALGLE